MSKRNLKDSKSNYFSPAKKQRLSITYENGSKSNNRQSSSKQKDDIWGEDFQEEDLQNIDLVASQALSQVVNCSIDERFAKEETTAKTTTKPKNNWSVPSFGAKNHVPSPKKSPTVIYPTPSTSNSNKQKKESFLEPKVVRKAHDTKTNNLQKATSPSDEMIHSSTQSSQMNFTDFQTKLLNEKNMNSTLLLPNSFVYVPDDSQLDQISKLKEEKEKLIKNLTTRKGEIDFLRQELKREQQRVTNGKLEKHKSLIEQENAHKIEIMALKKERDNITTQLHLKTLEMNTLKDKTGILERGSVKLVEPQSANSDSGKRNTTINSYRKSTPVKVKFKECATQVEINETNYELRDSVIIYPLKQIPESIFERSETEMPIIDIHTIDKIGKRNLPILQDTNNLRVFENTEVVKPIVTFVDNNVLNVQFFLSNLSKILIKTTEEINSSGSLPIINMIIATSRELLLNTSTSLKKILDVLTKDDIRDMNDFYLSKYSTIKISHADNIFSAKKLFEKERAVEARRSLAVVSYIVQSSTYLGEYITGKRRLKINDDYSYKHYSKQLKTYNSWSNRDCDFEFLEMVLQFVTIMGSTRNAHQFCGLINAIILTLNNAQKIVGFCSTGLKYIYKIFKEIVFSRPLVYNIPAVSEMMMTFARCREFNDKLCYGPKYSIVSSSNDVWYFKLGPTTCTIEIFISQIKKLIKDPIILMNTSCALVSFLETMQQIKFFPWKDGQRHYSECSSLLISFALKSLHECTKVNIDNLEASFQNLSISSDLSKIPEKDFWYKLRRKQEVITRRGFEYFSNFMYSEFDYILKRAEVAYTLFLFIQHVENMSAVKLPDHFEKQKERLYNIIKEPTKEVAQIMPNEMNINEKHRKFNKFNKNSEWKSSDRLRKQCFCGNLKSP